MKILPYGFSWKCLRTINADCSGDTANDQVLTELIPFSEPCVGVNLLLTRLERIYTLGSGSRKCMEGDHFLAEAICRI